MSLVQGPWPADCPLRERESTILQSEPWQEASPTQEQIMPENEGVRAPSLPHEHYPVLASIHGGRSSLQEQCLHAGRIPSLGRGSWEDAPHRGGLISLLIGQPWGFTLGVPTFSLPSIPESGRKACIKEGGRVSLLPHDFRQSPQMKSQPLTKSQRMT